MPPVTVADSLSTQRPDRERLGLEHTREFVDRVFGADLHALRVLSLANGVAGVLNAAVLSIHAIGQAYANVAKITAKSGVKQVDRMLGNDALSLDIVLARWVRFVVGENASILIALDWTDFDKDDHTTLCAYMVTTHGRAMPLAWNTVKKSALKDQRTRHELEMVERLHTWLPENVNITLLADRAFGYQELYALLEAFGWDFVIRFRGCILVESAEGAVRPAENWVSSNGRPKLLVGARVTDKRAAVGAVVLVKAARMKEAWCLATSLATAKAAEVVKLYGRRFTIEETFRDTKDLHFGMGLSATHIRDAARRDRLLLLVAMAHTLLTLLGAASEASGLDRTLKVNTVKKRTHSLYRQGLYWYHCVPTMREEWLRRLMDAFDRIVREHAFFSHFFEVK
ncbi:IS4 family transposase [Sorangium sp. So ce764]|uniref:IS4 family transposase n=1 Tax=Sorangium sp. So ce764 TaxID=3133320 RepID=UPI003F60649B